MPYTFYKIKEIEFLKGEKPEEEGILPPNAKIKIPMLGELDSLNVSVSAAVLCYEAVRQRNL